jgi:transposase
VTSDGQHYRAPRISDRQAARYLGLQRRLARQRKGSRQRERTRQAMALIAARVTDRRKDWAEKVSTRLIRDNDLIVLEKLNIAGMTRRPKPKPDPGQPGAFLPNRARAKAGLSRGILASAWGVLGQRVKDKGEASGIQVVFVDPRFTSQQCHACGHTDAANRDSQAVFACVSCGHQDHADRNAALNILARGLTLTAGEPVPAPAAGHAAPCPHQPAPAAAGTTQAV